MPERRSLMLALMFWLTVPAGAAEPELNREEMTQEEMTLEGTRIYGHRELPKALYVVPWRSTFAGDLVGRPLVSVLDEVISPIEREALRAQLERQRASGQGASTTTTDGPDERSAAK